MAGLMVENLYGDNMCMVVPHEAQNVSEIREVNSNQEVFVHKKSDQSLILEILEFVDEPDHAAIKTHFEDLAISNDATGPGNSSIELIEQIPQHQIAMNQCSRAFYILGKQMVAKFKETAKNEVEIHMALFRLPEYKTDILLSMNDPKSISPQSSSSKHPAEADRLWTADHFKQCIMSLQILDIDFLGGEDE